jgi:hypothetical protein
MNIEDYTEKSFVVFGETKNFKETLKELGGKYNSNLKVGPGWVFSKSNKEQVEQWMNSISNIKYISNIKSKEEREFSMSKMIDEYSNKIFEIDEDFDLKKMDKYRMSFLQMLISKKNEISFEEFNKLDVDKIIIYSYIIWSRTM